MPIKSTFGSRFFGNRYQRYVEELTTEGTIEGRPLSPAERKEGFKKRNDKINFNKFVEKVLKKKPLSSGGSFGTSTVAANPGSFGGIVKSDPGKMVGYDPLIAINNALDNILQVLRNEAKEEEKHQNWLRRLMETYKRRKKENKLEFKILDGIKKTAETLLKPFRSAWQQLWDFISTVVLGRILFKLLEWVGNNQGKIKAIFTFLEKTWPVLLAAYLLFGNSLTKFITRMIVRVGVWTVKIVSQLIPQLMAALAKLKGGKLLKMLGGKKAMRAMQVGGLLVGAHQLHGRMTDGGDDAQGVQGPGTKQPETQEFKKGGFVSGPSGTDRVPAKLTAGEFVMSTGAVQKFGVGTMSAMNAAGGGTNRPRGGRYNTGGEVTKGNEPSAIAGIAEGIPFTYEQELQTMIIRHKHRTEELNEAIQRGQGVDSTKRRHSRATRGLIKYTNNNPKVVANLSVVDKKYIDLLVNSDKPTPVVKSRTETSLQGAQDSLKDRVSSSKKSPLITPPVKMKSTQAYQKELKKANSKEPPKQPSNKVPSFDATAMRSPQKISILGISV